MQTCCRSGSAVRASRSPEPSAFLSPDFLGPEKPRKRSRSLFGGIFGKKEVKAHILYYMYGCIMQGAGMQGCTSILKLPYVHNNLGKYSLGFLQLWMTISWFCSLAYQLKSQPTKEQKQFNLASLQ